MSKAKRKGMIASITSANSAEEQRSCPRARGQAPVAGPIGRDAPAEVDKAGAWTIRGAQALLDRGASASHEGLILQQIGNCSQRDAP